VMKKQRMPAAAYFTLFKNLNRSALCFKYIYSVLVFRYRAANIMA
jgi:hypothetical protein